MGDSFSAISDDIDDYLRRCKRFREEPEVSYGSPDCYGKHAIWLEELSLRDNIRRGVTHPCNWGPYRKNSVKDLDAWLDKFYSSSPKETVVQVSVSNQEPTRWSQLELDSE